VRGLSGSKHGLFPRRVSKLASLIPRRVAVKLLLEDFKTTKHGDTERALVPMDFHARALVFMYFS